MNVTQRRSGVFRTGLVIAFVVAVAGWSMLGVGAAGASPAAAVLSEVEPAPEPPAEAPADAPAEAPVDVEPAALPQLSITISDGLDAATAGDDLAYTIVIENLGAADAIGLTITQSVPEGMTFGSADTAGALDGSQVVWTVDVKAAEKATLSTTMTVGETPADLLRLATVACALPTPTDAPIVCASDSDILPAGEAADRAADESTAPAGVSVWWWIGGAAALVVIAAATVLVVLRLRRRDPRTGRA